MKKRKRRKYKPLPPLEELKEYLDYNPDTGILTWIKQPVNTVEVGQEAGSKHSKGYIIISFKGNSYFAHRIAYYMYHGIDLSMWSHHIEALMSQYSIQHRSFSHNARAALPPLPSLSSDNSVNNTSDNNK